MRAKLKLVDGGNAPGGPTPPRRNRHLTMEQRINLLNLVSQLLADNIPDRQIVYMCGLPESESKRIPSVSGPTARKFIEMARQQWVEESKRTREYNKKQAVQRLYRDRRNAARERRWNAVLGFETLLARMQGTLEPERVNVSFTRAETIATIMSSMSEQEIEQLAHEQLQRAQDAEQYRRLMDERSKDLAAMPVSGETVEDD